MNAAFAARLAASLIVALVIGFSIRYNTFAAWATDSGAYISAGQQWARGDLFHPAEFAFWAPWAAANPEIEAPLGHVPGPTKGTLTGQYPLGYPVLIGAAMKIGGPLAGHVVAPLLAGLLAWCGFLLGRMLSTPWAGVLAALMIASTPVVTAHIVFPMSDVPATAFWALAWVMSLRAGLGAATAAGSATAMAVMIRPNLAPLALVLAATVIASERAGLAHAARRLVTYGLTAAIGPLMVLWSQAVLYGSPLKSGYPGAAAFFDLSRIPQNAALYPRMLYELHSIVAFAGLLFVPFAIRRARADTASYRAAVLAAGAVGIIIINYAIFLAYLTYEGWYWLRFMLPAMFALFLLLAGGLDAIRVRLRPRWRWAGLLVLIPVGVVVLPPFEGLRVPLGFLRLHIMGHYLREAIPPRTVFLTFSHGGALLASTGRPVLRLDLIPAEALEPIVAELQRRGYRPAYVLDVAIEGDQFTTKFRGSELSRLTWPARAQITSVSNVLYHQLPDRDRFLRGDRWQTDVLLEPPVVQPPIDWPAHRPPGDRVLWPLNEEMMAFRARLEAIYLNDLGRAAAPVAVPVGESLLWTRRYIRYRVHGCDHTTAASNVFAQIDGGAVAPLCATTGAVRFPGWQETVEFRRALEDKFRAAGSAAHATAVDLEGEAVWVQHYMELRVDGCPHDAATNGVVERIVKGTAARCR